MEQFLFSVEDRFQIASRGLVLTPDVPREVMRNRPSGFSATVRLKRPDGAVLRAEARLGIEFSVPTGSRFSCTLPETAKEDVPVGTEVWLCEPERPGADRLTKPSAGSRRESEG